MKTTRLLVLLLCVCCVGVSCSVLDSDESTDETVNETPGVMHEPLVRVTFHVEAGDSLNDPNMRVFDLCRTVHLWYDSCK